MNKVPRSVALASLVAVSAVANAAVTVCKHGKSERKVEVAYAEQGKKVPCEVKYTKDGSTTTLWTATAKEGFCEEKATGFIGKFVEQGYDCKDEETGDTAKGDQPKGGQAR